MLFSRIAGFAYLYLSQKLVGYVLRNHVRRLCELPVIDRHLKLHFIQFHRDKQFWYCIADLAVELKPNWE